MVLLNTDEEVLGSTTSSSPGTSASTMHASQHPCYGQVWWLYQNHPYRYLVAHEIRLSCSQALGRARLVSSFG